MAQKRNFKRPPPTRSYKKLFIIAVEGRKTEPQYFKILEQLDHSRSVISILKHKTKNAPNQVLKRMKKALKEESLKKSDEAWLVVDRDQWQDEELNALYNWSQEEENYGFALSNPKFEYWLLLHFEDGNKISCADNCIQRLKKRLPEYDKNLTAIKLNNEMIRKAIKRAKKRDNPPCDCWAYEIGKTTVYKLIENILKS